MALSWALRDDRITSVLIGASSVEQLDENLDALKNPDFSADELSKIDAYATEGHIDLWREVAED
jgi:L-glyceraldehyde 3-phosphate reductase